MAQLVITVIGDDRAGLVDSLAGAIAGHRGNWDRSHMAELAGKFAGVVLVTVPDASVEGLVDDLHAIETTGLLDITVERAADDEPGPAGAIASLRLVGQDHPGIVHDVSHVLASHDVSIEELATEVSPAPMAGHLFRAEATLLLPSGLALDVLEAALEAVAADLMVDLDPVEER